MKIEVSNGELIDKFLILYIKLYKISNKSKVDNIKKEFSEIRPFVQQLFSEYGQELKNLFWKLDNVNSNLWNIEDSLRILEKKKKYNTEEFIELARSVYKENDKRAKIKKEINILTKSTLIEEKSYRKYK